MCIKSYANIKNGTYLHGKTFKTHLKGGNKTAHIYVTHHLNVPFFMKFLQGKMYFLLTTVFLEIMKAGGYKGELL